jgi:hypothetical protein
MACCGLASLLTFIIIIIIIIIIIVVVVVVVYSGSKFCPSILKNVGLRVPARCIRDFALFTVCSSCKNCPSARCVTAANVMGHVL